MRASASDAAPISILRRSAVGSPIVTLYLFRTKLAIDSSNLSPAIRIERLDTIPPKEIVATSVVPPPISTTIEPVGSITGKPAPTAAANGSSIT